MKLEDLVPPIELCQQIPEGEFEDSVFVFGNKWCDNDGMPYRCETEIYVRENVIMVDQDTLRYHHAKNVDLIEPVCPAPTLGEIMEGLARLETCPRCNWHINLKGMVCGFVEASLQSVGFCGNEVLAAALKMWLRLNKEEE